MAVAVAQETRERDRVAVGAQVLAAAAVLRRALKPGLDDCLDPLERAELAALVRRAEELGVYVGGRQG
jgi:hypothetical protein